ncbi:hypothetical protein MNEG_8892 [Monoraphidium neglectum]|uniref:Methyltransferase type 11 domain-containing protein n=1 Tax=Monoraphidium neglectum TaxID=145388 RepID=A0A0D2MEC6_9CHLO|nr:hypothetical protein MNEG_8892 [Monoraphidium neglectum]KIY99071.1 hypothetical protein MNEG_8892 [Monoraphidium neglectum]|eukprot:XP_013898091.1 hypothetical protein MNEG_8892 [Monoraphidium neglectum]
MVGMLASGQGGSAEAIYWKRVAVFTVACSVSVVALLTAKQQALRKSPVAYFSVNDAGYKNANLVPMWAFHEKPRYSAYYNLADWLLENPDKATGHGLEISGASFLQQFFVGATWDRRNYPEVDVMALHRAVAPGSYDWIILDQVLEHVSLPFLAVAEIHRALKPGGRVLLADYWRMSHDALRVLLSIFSEVEVCGSYRSMEYIRNYLDKSEGLGKPAYASLAGVPNQDEEAFEIAKGDAAQLTPSGELVVNGNQFIVHSWAIARK